jgi:hypothetical protein
MKVNRICFETVIFGTAIAFASAVLIATLAAATAALTQPADAEVLPSAVTSAVTSQASFPVRPVSAQDTESATTQSQTFEGMVTCSKCGAKHSAAIGRNAADCTRGCVRTGASFALIDGEKIYMLDGDLMAIKKVAGERARLVGALQGNTIQVASVTAEE